MLFVRPLLVAALGVSLQHARIGKLDAGSDENTGPPSMMAVKPTDIEVGAYAASQFFSQKELGDAVYSKGTCKSQGWSDRFGAVHSLASHTYILTMPRAEKIAAAKHLTKTCADDHARLCSLCARVARGSPP